MHSLAPPPPPASLPAATGFSSSTSVLASHYHYFNIPYVFIHILPTLLQSERTSALSIFISKFDPAAYTKNQNSPFMPMFRNTFIKVKGWQ